MRILRGGEMSKPTGGLAFARPFSRSDNGYDADRYGAQNGMTVRQLYAGIAMHALLSANPERRFQTADIAIEAHEVADSMIAASGK